jgi:hypothetical protein
MDTFSTMKTNHPRSFLALFALSFVAVTRLQAATPSAAASEQALLSPGEIGLDSVNAPRRVNGDTVTPGTSRIMVSMRLGSPSMVLPDGSWLYRGYNAYRTDAGASSAAPGSDREIVRSGTLIVRFTAQKVASLSLADEPTVAQLRQKSRNTDDRSRVAAGR